MKVTCRIALFLYYRGPGTLESFWGLVRLSFSTKNVTQHSDQGRRGTNHSFLSGCSQQQLFLNPFQTSESRSRKEGVLCFQTPESRSKKGSSAFAESGTSWCFCVWGSEGAGCDFTVESGNWWDIWEILLLKTQPHFQGCQPSVFFQSHLSPPRLLFPPAPLGLMSRCPHGVSSPLLLMKTLPGGQLSDFRRTAKNNHPHVRLLCAPLSVDSFPDI